MVMGWDGGELSKTPKKTMEGVGERRQQKKYLEAKGKAKSGVYVAKRIPGKKCSHKQWWQKLIFQTTAKPVQTTISIKWQLV